MGKQLRNALLLVLILHLPLWAYDPNYTTLKDNKLPKELENIGVDDTTGKSIDLNLHFVDSEGKDIVLKDMFHKGKPVLLSPVYFKCPTLCNYHMNGVLDVLKKLDWDVGNQFHYIAVSINPKEGPDLALEKKLAYTKEYGREGGDQGYHLLTGKQAEITALTKELGFRYEWDEESQQYIHASATYVLTPEGKISRIFQGIVFDSRDLKLAFIEAGDGKIGNFVDQFALFCFQFDPSKNRYTLYAYNLMRIGGGVTLFIVAAFLFAFWKKYKRENDRGVA